jgi:hypothetical protein
MALKTAEKPVVAEPPVDTVTLELALYTQYTWGGTTYEKGTAYKFKRDDAMLLLSEQDHGRPIWKQYNPPKPKQPARTMVVDSTEMRAVRTRTSLEEAANMRPGQNTGKRIDVGTDEEIADVLNQPDDSGDVTV